MATAPIDNESDMDSQISQNDTESQIYFRSIRIAVEHEFFEEGVLQTKNITRPATIRPDTNKFNPQSINNKRDTKSHQQRDGTW